MPNGFDHLDRYQLVELTGQVSVIFEEQGDFVLKSSLLDFCARILQLLTGNCGGGYLAAVVLCSINRHAPPARADFNQMIGWLQLEILAYKL